MLPHWNPDGMTGNLKQDVQSVAAGSDRKEMMHSEEIPLCRAGLEMQDLEHNGRSGIFRTTS